ncbi:MAG: T9SS type A sorting domain-containing protein [candidate division Zixibacteria bacterium]|nr:T9SS type A sorting domain-containing protein [candidate division Zixibacteria bacterium]
MKRSKLFLLLFTFLLLTSLSRGDFRYAVVVNNSTYQIPEWGLVADTLVSRYNGEIFIWQNSTWDLRQDLIDYKPTHIAFVCEALTANSNFVQTSIWTLTRALDDDPYGDAIWGIITGYNAADALRLATCGSFRVKNMLGGTMSCDLGYYPQGICTSEGTYNRIRFKYLDGTIVDTTDEDLCPNDRTGFLMNMINADTIDIFMTSGHGNHDNWQLHYPTPDLEGFFRSNAGQLYGDPRYGSNINANSINPKIYLALGNCYVGKIQNLNSMAPAWIHTGGASLMTGYVIPEGSDSYQHGGTKAYFARQGLYTWPEAFFLANQALYFDQIHHTPGTNPPDLNGSALYGDPALDARLDTESGVIPGSMYDEQIEIVPGDTQDTVTVRIVMNREDYPGYNGKWGNRHPIVLFPFRAENPIIISYDPDCHSAMVTEEFLLMCIWHQNEPPLPAGAVREFVFTCDHMTTSVEEPTALSPVLPNGITLSQNYPNPFNAQTRIEYHLSSPMKINLAVYNLRGELVNTLYNGHQSEGTHNLIWDGRNNKGDEVVSGIYFYRLTSGDISESRSLLMLK